MSETNATNTPPANEVPDTGHDYDGIRELDNHLPNWWLFTLYASIAFGFGYWVYYHAFDATPDQMEEYRLELARNEAKAEAFAKERGTATDEILVAYAKDQAKIDDGKAAYATFCASCHGMKGEGLIGPNLTDGFWLHGNKPTEILQVVAKGVLAKGMPAWESQLGVGRTEHVVAYLLTIQNTNVPGKEPQGTELTQR